MTKPGPKESALRDMRNEVDHTPSAAGVPKFLERKDDTEAALRRQMMIDADKQRVPAAARSIQSNPSRASAAATTSKAIPPATQTTTRSTNTETSTKQQETDMSTKKATTKAKAKTTKAKGTKRAAPTRDLRPDGLVKGSKMALLVDTVCRQSGATNDQLCTAVGWAQCLPMMKKGCEKAGVKLRTEKVDGKPTRYFGTPKERKADPKAKAPKPATAEPPKSAAAA